MKFIKNNYYLHLIVGALISLSLNTTYSGVPIIIQLFLSGFVVGVIAGMWEWGWEMYNGSPVDYWDVKWSIIGALVAQIVCVLC